MTNSSFTRKQLRFTFTLEAGRTFPGTSSSQLRLEGLRASIDLTSAGLLYPEVTARIFGMRQADMNLLPFFGPPGNPRAVAPATFLVESNDGGGWLAVFQGQIVLAGPDYSAAPDVCLAVDARSLYFGSVSPGDVRTYPGTVLVATVASAIAADMQARFENNGVTATVTNPYLPGSNGAQLQTLAEWAGVDLYVDEKDNTVVLCNRLQPRANLQPVLLNAQSGMIGYPTYDNIGPTVEVLYNPAIRIGGKVQIDSEFSFANGEWTVFHMSTSLSSETPSGPWFSSLQCCRFLVGGTPQ